MVEVLEVGSKVSMAYRVSKLVDRESKAGMKANGVCIMEGTASMAGTLNHKISHDSEP